MPWHRRIETTRFPVEQRESCRSGGAYPDTTSCLGRNHYFCFAPFFLGGSLRGPSPKMSFLDLPTGGADPTSASLQPPRTKKPAALKPSARRRRREFSKLRESFMFNSQEIGVPNAESILGTKSVGHAACRCFELDLKHRRSTILRFERGPWQVVKCKLGHGRMGKSYQPLGSLVKTASRS